MSWAIAAAALVVAVTAVLVAWRTERALRKELQASADRFGVDGLSDGGVETAFARLERAATDADRQAREAERARDVLTAAMQASPDGVIVVDTDGDVVLRSEAAQRYVDPRHADALAAEVITELLDRARQGESARRELQLFGPPRQVLLVESIPLMRHDEIIGAVAFVRDVSEARRIESVRRDFVANVTHELKTPIGALALLAETVAMGDDPTVAQQLAERMVREADRLGRIIDDLLDLSLIEAQETPTRDPVPVHVLLNDAVDHVREAADLAGIPLVVAPVPPHLVVRCDARQVVSAIANLLDNAIKYSDPGRPVELDGRVDGDRIALTVRDHGIGIPSRDLERIFERFYRVDRARSRATGGTGLGLSIVRHVVQAHGGEVKVESREGEGSTFTLFLPTARRHAGGTNLKVS